MNDLKPINQIELFGLNNFFNELVKLDNLGKFPSKIFFSGQKGIGKSTLAYHFINFVLSKNEKFSYDLSNLKINIENPSFRTVLNGSNPNFLLVDVNPEKKHIDINQIRNLISSLTKSSFNSKPRFVLIDNIEFLNLNSINALLKIREEPSHNVHFILINNNKKILKTLSSRCLNFKIYLSNNQILEVSQKILNNDLYEIVNKELINYYITPGNIYNLVKFSVDNKYDLKDTSLKEFLKILIKENHFKKNSSIKYLFYDLVEFYLSEINFSMASNIFDKYNYFLKRISEIRRFNLDEDSLFLEFNNEILNG